MLPYFNVLICSNVFGLLIGMNMNISSFLSTLGFKIVESDIKVHYCSQVNMICIYLPLRYGCREKMWKSIKRTKARKCTGKKSDILEQLVRA